MSSSLSRFRKSLLGVVLGLAGLALVVGLDSQFRPPPPPLETFKAYGGGAYHLVADSKVPNRLRHHKALGRLPLAFEENRGQTDDRVRYVLKGGAHAVYLMPSEVVLTLNRGSAGATASHAVIRMRMLGADATARVEGMQQQAGRSNYFIGNDSTKWRTDVPRFGKVRSSGVYPGTDVVYYGTDSGRLEYDFVVAPGADPARIRLAFDGAERISIDKGGDLLLDVAGGQITQRAPVVYQNENGKRRRIDARYRLRDGQVSFDVAQYDRRKPLVIDPVLGFSTFFGGTAIDVGRAVAVDQNGYVYVTGKTASTDFPTTTGAFQTSAQGSGDAFVIKLDPNGNSLIYATYLGGTDDDLATDICVDNGGNALLTGTTDSSDFPTQNAFQTGIGGGNDAIVVKVNPAGNGLVYSSFLGGGLNENIDGNGAICVDGAGNAYLTGTTYSDNPGTPAFPIMNPMTGFGSRAGSTDAFIVKVDSAGAQQFGSFWGGSTSAGASPNDPWGQDDGWAIAVDGSGNLYVGGSTNSTDFPTDRGAYTTYGGERTDGFVSRLLPVGNSFTPDYSTYLGGGVGAHGSERVTDICVDTAGNLYVTGYTGSSDFPTTSGVFQTSKAGPLTTTDVFVTSIPAPPPTGTVPIGFSTFLGGASDDNLLSGDDPTDAPYEAVLVGTGGIALDESGNIWVAGNTRSADFPIAGAFQGTNAGGIDGFAAALNPTGTSLVFGSYLGGGDDDDLYGLAGDPGNCAMLVTGWTASGDFPLLTPLQATTDNSNGFLAKVLTTLPLGTDDSYSVDEESTLTVPAPGVLTNDACATSVSLVANASNGALTLNPDGSFNYSPNADFFGTDTFTYRASQGAVTDASDTTVTITVNGMPDAPVASDDQFGGSQGRTLRIGKPGVLGNDVDVDMDVLSAVLVSSPVTGTLTLNTDGSFVWEPPASFEGTQTFSYQATDGTLSSGTAVVTLTTATAADVPVARLSAGPGEGYAPVTTLLDGSQSTDPNGVALTGYNWIFGDGTVNTTANATVSYTYDTPGNYVVGLYVTNANGLSSDPVYYTIPVADGQTGDSDLYVSSWKYSVNHANHAKGTPRDNFSFSALINPAGLPDSIGGTANIILRFNNGLTFGSIQSRARSRASARANGGGFIALLSPSTGKLTVKGKNVDMRPILGVTDETAEKKVRTEIEVEITDVPIDTPRITAVLESNFKSSAGKKATGKFSFLTLGTLTGAIKSQRTKAIESKGGGHKVIAQGPLTPDLAGPIVPTGDITITIGSPSANVVITVPVAALKQSGAGAKTVLTYSKSLQEITELKKFQINNGKRKFVLATNELNGTGIPAAASAVLNHDLPVSIDVPTASGVVHLETTVELKRKKAGSKVWAR